MHTYWTITETGRGRCLQETVWCPLSSPCPWALPPLVLERLELTGVLRELVPFPPPAPSLTLPRSLCHVPLAASASQNEQGQASKSTIMQTCVRSYTVIATSVLYPSRAGAEFIRLQELRPPHKRLELNM